MNSDFLEFKNFSDHFLKVQKLWIIQIILVGIFDLEGIKIFLEIIGFLIFFALIGQFFNILLTQSSKKEGIFWFSEQYVANVQ